MTPAASANPDGSPNRAAPDAKRRVGLILLGICALALALRLLHGSQLDGLDDAGYLSAAGNVASGHLAPQGTSLFGLRVGMSYPLGSLVGAGVLRLDQFWMLTLLVDLLGLLAIFMAARSLWDDRTGLLAAALYAAYPLAIQQACFYYPTVFQVAGLSIGFALLVATRNNPRFAYILAWLGGLAAGLGYLAKEDVAIAIAAISASMVMTRAVRLSVVLAFCAGAGTVFLAESLSYRWLTGDFLLRLHGTAEQGAQNVSDQTTLAGIWKWDAYIRSLWVLPYQVGLYWWLAIPCAVIVLKSADRGTRAVGVCLLLTFGYLQFGSGSFSSYSPLPKTPRYTAIATPFMIATLAFGLRQLFGRLSSLMRRSLVAALVLTALPCIAFSSLGSGERTRNTLAALQAIQSRGITSVQTDFYSARLLNLLAPGLGETFFHADWKKGVTQLLVEPDHLNGKYVLIDRQLAKIYTSSYEFALPPLVEKPPDSWEVVWSRRAYPDGSAGRSFLAGIRAIGTWLPGPLRSRIVRNVDDMFQGDQAVLFRVPAAR